MYVKDTRNTVVGRTPPAEEKKRTMIVLVNRDVAPVGTFPAGSTWDNS